MSTFLKSWFILTAPGFASPNLVMHAFSGVQEFDQSVGLDEGMDVLQRFPDNPDETDLATPLETRTSQPVEDSAPITADLPIGGGEELWVLQISTL